MSPNYLTREDVPAELVETERRIAEETAKAEGKPEAAMTKIVEGRVTGFYKGEVLLDQAFAKDAKKSVAQVLEEAGVKGNRVRALPRRSVTSVQPPRRTDDSLKGVVTAVAAPFACPDRQLTGHRAAVAFGPRHDNLFQSSPTGRHHGNRQTTSAQPNEAGAACC